MIKSERMPAKGVLKKLKKAEKVVSSGMNDIRRGYVTAADPKATIPQAKQTLF
jgi:hypothetical protein